MDSASPIIKDLGTTSLSSMCLIDTSPPSLVDRAISVPFLLATVGKAWPKGRFKTAPSDVSKFKDLQFAPQCPDGRFLRELKVCEVVEHFIKPATLKAGCSYAQAFKHGCLDTGLDSMMHPMAVEIEQWRLPEIGAWRDLTGDPRFVLDLEGAYSKVHEVQLSALGHVTWFVSHTWNRGWMELVNTLWQHYLQQPHSLYTPGHWGGLCEVRALPIYYWVDIFAVSQHTLNKLGAVSKHPDLNFPDVIAAARGTVLTLIPWQSPASVTRVWCLFEVMHTIQEGKLLSLIPERDFWERSLKITASTIQELVESCVDSLDMEKAEASFPADKVTIFAEVEQGIGFKEFNRVIKGHMLSRLLESLVLRALKARDEVALEVCSEFKATISRPLLGLGHHHIGTRCGIHLASFVMMSTTVTELELTANALGDAGAIALAKALATMPCLGGVDIGNNGITEKGAFAITEAISKSCSTTWRTLCIDKNPIGDQGALAIVASLKGGKEDLIDLLWLRWCGLSSNAVATLKATWADVKVSKPMAILAVEHQFGWLPVCVLSMLISTNHSIIRSPAIWWALQFNAQRIRWIRQCKQLARGGSIKPVIS